MIRRNNGDDYRILAAREREQAGTRHRPEMQRMHERAAEGWLELAAQADRHRFAQR